MRKTLQSVRTRVLALALAAALAVVAAPSAAAGLGVRKAGDKAVEYGQGGELVEVCVFTTPSGSVHAVHVNACPGGPGSQHP